jgi:hypothetical protein
MGRYRQLGLVGFCLMAIMAGKAYCDDPHLDFPPAEEEEFENWEDPVEPTASAVSTIELNQKQKTPSEPSLFGLAHSLFQEWKKPPVIPTVPEEDTRKPVRDLASDPSVEITKGLTERAMAKEVQFSETVKEASMGESSETYNQIFKALSNGSVKARPVANPR